LFKSADVICTWYVPSYKTCAVVGALFCADQPMKAMFVGAEKV